MMCSAVSTTAYFMAKFSSAAVWRFSWKLLQPSLATMTLISLAKPSCTVSSTQICVTVEIGVQRVDNKGVQTFVKLNSADAMLSGLGIAETK